MPPFKSGSLEGGRQAASHNKNYVAVGVRGMKQDLTGRRFGYLTVLGKSSRGDARHPYWDCLCDCGNRKTVEESHLKNGHTKSCGCYRKKVLSGLTTDLSGLRFGGLTAIGAVPGTDGRDTYWLCRCDCGNWMVCQQDSLRQGLAKCCEACRDKRRAGKAPAAKEEKTDQVQRISGRKLYANNTSGRKGVYKKGENRWRASIGFHGKIYHLGTFQTYEDAVRARRGAEDIFCGFSDGHTDT